MLVFPLSFLQNTGQLKNKEKHQMHFSLSERRSADFVILMIVVVHGALLEQSYLLLLREASLVQWQCSRGRAVKRMQSVGQEIGGDTWKVGDVRR